LTLYCHSGWDFYTTTRATKDAPWGPRVSLGPVVVPSTSYRNGTPLVSADGLELFFLSERPGGYGGNDIWVSTRTTTAHPWGTPVNLGPAVNTPAIEAPTWLSPDGLTLLLISDRPGGFGGADMWVTTRTSRDSPWSSPRNLGPSINTIYSAWIRAISPDGWCYIDDFLGPRPGGLGGEDIWQASITPVVDFNGDGQVDGKDVLCLASRWGTDDPLCDIGPFAWGDGTVDLQDLIVLSDYLGKEIVDPTLIAHWALDETEGDTAKDSVNGEDAFVMGEPVWQPNGGMVGGALELDGIDDCIVTSNVLNPANGPFSVLAWVKDGAPGQVVVSQQGTADLLAVDAEGNLMTELKGSGRPTGPLSSETVITDGQWHRIGLTWDGSHTMLYVDGVLVAEDTQNGLEGSEMGLNIGAGKTTQPGT